MTLMILRTYYLFALNVHIDILVFILFYTPAPCEPSAWLNNEIHVVGGWCCCTHIFSVETNAGKQNR